VGHPPVEQASQGHWRWGQQADSPGWGADFGGSAYFEWGQGQPWVLPGSLADYGAEKPADWDRSGWAFRWQAQLHEASAAGFPADVVAWAGLGASIRHHRDWNGEEGRRSWCLVEVRTNRVGIGLGSDPFQPVPFRMTRRDKKINSEAVVKADAPSLNQSQPESISRLS
jgi:hypothetical protein